MMQKLITFLLFGLLLPAAIFAQATEKTPDKSGISPELRDKAVKFLRATTNDVANLRTPENRLGLNAELANLMWFHDEKEARQMFGAVITDFRQLLIQLDSQISALSVSANDVGETMPFFSGADTEKAKFSHKFYKAVGVRRQIALSLAENDAILAYEFFDTTAQAISNPELRQLLTAQDSGIEAQLLQKIAEQDPDKALAYGRKTLAKGYNPALLEVLKKIYTKDAGKGTAFAAEIVGKIKSETIKPEMFYQVSSILEAGAENLAEIKDKPGTKPMFSESDLRDIANLLAQAILQLGDDGINYASEEYISNIERFQPNRAAQIRKKLFPQSDNSPGRGTAMISAPTVAAAAPPAPPDPEKQLEDNLKNLENKQLPPEEREKIIAEARRIIAQNEDRSQKLTALTLLAMQAVKFGDKSLAADILRDTESLVNQQPKNYRDFMEVWMLVGGYAQVDANRAFPLLEDAIYRLSDTIGAFIKVGEFMDVGGDMIEDGEVQISGFGGEMTRDLLGSLGAADGTILALAQADFDRTAALTDKFSQPEARVLARMLVLRAILGNIADGKKEDGSVGMKARP